MSIYTYTQGEHTMFKVLNSFLSFIEAIRSAKHAADLARNGKYAEAQAMYRD